MKSPTDDPAEVRTLDVVHAAEHGNLVMSSGPFMEVTLRGSRKCDRRSHPGDDLNLPGGRAVLRVNVQCPNWFDVDRVQVFLNGRPAESLNFTRQSSPGRFSDGNVKFEQEIPIQVKGDTHVIVAAIGEDRRLGMVMGPEHAADRPWLSRIRSSSMSTAADSKPIKIRWEHYP